VVEEDAVTLAESLSDSHDQRVRSTLASFGLDALLTGAARLRADRPGLVWSGDGVTPGEMTYRDWDAAATAVAGALAACGFAPGERALIVGAADPATLTLLFGVARAGLDAALCPAGEPAPRIAERARAVAASAILAPGRIGPASVAAEIAAAAALDDQVRLAAVWGDAALADGVLALHDVEPAPLGRAGAQGAIFTFGDLPGAPQRHRQDRLAAAAFDLIHRARLGPLTPVLSTLAPVRHAGLVAGPLAALAAGATLHLHAPFCWRALDAALRGVDRAMLVAPAALGEEIVARADRPPLAGLALLRDALTPEPAPLPASPPTVDLWRWGETALTAAPRDAQGRAAAFPPQPHRFPLDDEIVTAVEWRRAGDGGWELRGAACAQGDVWAAP